MADSIELRMTSSIKRVDPYVKDILSTATHVALYKFNTTTSEWEKTETEGALFVYSRNGEPFHSIMVMNRLNTNNLIEPIVKDFDYQMQVPFLLYRNSQSHIFGIWFYNREECIRTTFLIESLMEGLKDKNAERPGNGKSNKENGVDIFSMLSKAQEDFNHRTPAKQAECGPSVFSSTPRIPDMTPQSVMDFFAKAGTKTVTKPIAGKENVNVLQRLMSNPAHSVEHIEKQQRSLTPQEKVFAAPAQKTPGQTDRRSVPIPFPGKKSPENGFSKIGSSVSPLAVLLQGGSQRQAEEPEIFGMSPSGVGVGAGAGIGVFMESSLGKPQLMTPNMFTTQKEKSVGSEVESIDLLTEKQLAQALIHLLKTNPDFTRQIHEAYVGSIMEKVNASSM